MTDVTQTLSDAVLASHQRLLDLCIDLVRVPSENLPGDTRAIATRVAEILAPTGAQVSLPAGEPTMPNVVAISRGRRPGRRLVFNGHLDTFPAGDRSAWSLDPFAGVVRDGRLYARGAADMKAGLAASLLTFALLHERRDDWDGELVLTFASDEETMGRWGTAYLLEHIPEARGDAMICGDTGSPMIVRFGEKGLLWLRVTARGRAGHGAHVHLGDNAAERLTEALRRLIGLRSLKPEIPVAVDTAMREAEPVSEPLSGTGETQVLRSVTVNIGKIAAGAQVNLIPDHATADLDVRLPLGVGIDACLAEAGKLLQGLSGVELEVLRRFEPTATDPGHEICRLLRDHGERVFGRRPVLHMRVGASDARLYRAAGIPTAVYGPTPHGVGGPDEHIVIEELYGLARVYCLTALAFLSGRRP